ncbi:hypothetical protein NEMIN01_0139 [Nematocida minor]|uniref:uncharacterized protein n=1 Tax=Nematocida minor TaxID=1912983 RepID=UPI00221FA560|nr:uncharacterized protein NEMIN01_0035 [Nematocida minor]XP_051332041.1 uncharacterized protein NEMIN01_0139 [Nematocida minor]KAI5188771.1 hypothetical protein NEMIN01_0035 [Nematocida minor]KAI5188875.1 hypothetical protein NEMIN01_0139 [Nematocida minor]
MMWSVLVLSQSEGSEWKHIEAAPYLKIRAVLSSDAVELYLKFFGCEERIASFSLSDLSVQKRYSSVAMFLSTRKVQMKLHSSSAADSMAEKISYVQTMRKLANGLSAITLKYAQNSTASQ